MAHNCIPNNSQYLNCILLQRVPMDIRNILVNGKSNFCGTIPVRNRQNTTFHESRKYRILNGIAGAANISDMMHKFFNDKFGYWIVLRYVFQPNNQKSIFCATAVLFFDFFRLVELPLRSKCITYFFVSGNVWENINKYFRENSFISMARKVMLSLIILIILFLQLNVATVSKERV